MGLRENFVGPQLKPILPLGRGNDVHDCAVERGLFWFFRDGTALARCSRCPRSEGVED